MSQENVEIVRRLVEAMSAPTEQATSAVAQSPLNDPLARHAPNSDDDHPSALTAASVGSIAEAGWKARVNCSACADAGLAWR
jgi:hypothetical protein